MADVDVFEELDEKHEEYDEATAKAAGKEAEKTAEADPKLEKNPFGSGEGDVSRAQRAARHVADFTQDDDLPVPHVPKNTEMVLVQDYAGRLKTWHYGNLAVVQEMAQNMKGRKRLFMVVPSKSELQEINALGDPINRG